MAYADIAYDDRMLFLGSRAHECNAKQRGTVRATDAFHVPCLAGAGRRRPPRVCHSQGSGVAYGGQGTAEHGNLVWNHQALAERRVDRGDAVPAVEVKRRAAALLRVDTERAASGQRGSRTDGCNPGCRAV